MNDRDSLPSNFELIATVDEAVVFSEVFMRLFFKRSPAAAMRREIPKRGPGLSLPL